MLKQLSESDNIKVNVMTNSIFLFADLMETTMLEMEQTLAKNKMPMRHEVKRQYRAALASVRKFKREVDHISLQSQEDYDNDSNMMLALFFLIIDRCGENDKKLYKIYQNIKLMKSALNLDFISKGDEAFLNVLNREKKE